MTRAEMLAIMASLDRQASALLSSGATDTELFIGMADHMIDFKRLIDSPYRDEIEAMSKDLPGLYHYAALLSSIAQGIADGSVEVPR